MQEVNSLWIVTFHFERGKVERRHFINKRDALRMIEITVFNNEDCINASVYRQDLEELLKPEVAI